ncbi:MAG: phosphate ABC transporter ATP-binding protein [Cellulosilyticaceae bacterium]
MTNTALTLDHVSVSYGDKTILHDLSLAIPKHSITAIIGPSGCGKSTLLKTLNLTVELDGGHVAGSVYYDKTSIRELPLETLRTQIGFVDQTPVVFPFSIYKNMTYALNYHHRLSKDALDSQVVASLQKAGIYDEVKDTLHQSATKLSGGQKQRLCIARALSIEPSVLLLDEPCSALDMRNTALIESTLKALKSNYTLILVTHQLSQAMRLADHVIFMEDGHIIESGTPASLFHHPTQQATKDYLSYMGAQ